MVLLLLLQPFRRVDLNVLASVAVQFSLVTIFLGGLFLKMFQEWSHWTSVRLAIRVVGVSSEEWIVSLLILVNFVVLALFVAVTIYQGFATRDLSSLRFSDNGQVPELRAAPSIKYHLFLSHIWASGQDQVANIKRQLQLLLPGVRIFLDVDDLDSIDNLEKHIEASQCILVFLSKGYFFSRNCLREIRHAMECKKRIVLVHEVDLNKGGMKIEELKIQCPDDLREFVFGADRWPREIIRWYRVADFQVVSLKNIAANLLHAMPGYKDKRKPPRVYLHGEISRKKLVFRSPIVLYASDANPGAVQAAEELCDRFNDQNIRVITKTPEKLSFTNPDNKGGVKLLGGAVSTAMDGSDSEPTTISSLKDAGMQTRRALKRAMSTAGINLSLDSHDADRPTHMLLYLNDQTFGGQQGGILAHEVRCARKHKLPILMIHETAPELGGVVEFGTFFQTTPDDLIRGGLYGALATPFHPMPHRLVSFMLTAETLGAKRAKWTDDVYTKASGVRSSLAEVSSRAIGASGRETSIAELAMVSGAVTARPTGSPTDTSTPNKFVSKLRKLESDRTESMSSVDSEGMSTPIRPTREGTQASRTESCSSVDSRGSELSEIGTSTGSIGMTFVHPTDSSSTNSPGAHADSDATEQEQAPGQLQRHPSRLLRALAAKTQRRTERRSIELRSVEITGRPSTADPSAVEGSAEYDEAVHDSKTDVEAGETRI